MLKMMSGKINILSIMSKWFLLSESV